MKTEAHNKIQQGLTGVNQGSQRAGSVIWLVGAHRGSKGLRFGPLGAIGTDI